MSHEVEANHQQSQLTRGEISLTGSNRFLYVRRGARSQVWSQVSWQVVSQTRVVCVWWGGAYGSVGSS